MSVTESEMTTISEIMEAPDVVKTKVDWECYNPNVNPPEGLCQERNTTWSSSTVHPGKLARLKKNYPYPVTHKKAGHVSGHEYFLEDI